MEIHAQLGLLMEDYMQLQEKNAQLRHQMESMLQDIFSLQAQLRPTAAPYSLEESCHALQLQAPPRTFQMHGAEVLTESEGESLPTIHWSRQVSLASASSNSLSDSVDTQ